MAFPPGWDNYFLLSITRRGGSAVEFAAIVDPTSLEINEGDNPAESMANAAAGRIWRDDPQEDGEVTFDIIPVELDPTTGIGLFQQFVAPSGGEGTAYATSEPLATDTSFPAGVNRVRDMFRIAILFTNDPAASTAAGSTAANTESERFFANNCKFISHKTNMSDKQQKTTVTFKFKPFDKAGTLRLYGYQSGEDTALVALNTYSVANFPD